MIVATYDTEVGFSYLIARWLSPRCLTRLGLCCVDWYDMVSDNYFQTLIASSSASPGLTGVLPGCAPTASA